MFSHPNSCKLRRTDSCLNLCKYALKASGSRKYFLRSSHMPKPERAAPRESEWTTSSARDLIGSVTSTMPSFDRASIFVCFFRSVSDRTSSPFQILLGTSDGFHIADFVCVSLS
eukprot:TRINITY_DN372_c0_g1_i5.p2 TRINITY_DN372_c0_g1~~TRINITY_DN372_c0_g1_i5.p2  ORF type:complete len:114 (+),score=2.12 TRINITY_DN372_c0_g1_i5:51-392(+)